MNEEALNLWIQITRVLELDNKARRDLFLLCQSDLVGRIQANKLIWKVLTGPALERKHLDLSHLVSNRVYKARREFDRPPREHVDLDWWTWECYDKPRKKDLKFSPLEVPIVPVIITGPGEKPLPPPQCWSSSSVWR